MLRSGNISNFYWDKYRFESHPALLTSIAEEMAKLLPSECDGLAGLELGGIPLATATLVANGTALFLRTEGSENIRHMQSHRRWCQGGKHARRYRGRDYDSGTGLHIH